MDSILQLKKLSTGWGRDCNHYEHIYTSHDNGNRFAAHVVPCSKLILTGGKLITFPLYNWFWHVLSITARIWADKLNNVLSNNRHEDVKNDSFNAYAYIPLLIKSIILLNKIGINCRSRKKWIFLKRCLHRLVT